MAGSIKINYGMYAALMKGGQHRYTGSGRGARAYIEADHHRADDYYLAEGEGIAQVVRVDGVTGAQGASLSLSGDDYEAWVEGVDVFDPDRPNKGVLRHDSKALRFVEVVVNGPKSWSLAAGLHPDVSAALDAAQTRAVEAISGYAATHVTTRAGGRGRQVQVPVDGIETAAIRHYTTRAGDPHRHIHLQINARVFARDKWRGIDSRAFSRMQRAINGIGHRAVMADPQFRYALAAHGFTLGADGEIVQLAAVVPAMSKRSVQVAANVARYEAQWRAENPGAEPGRELLRAWDTRAWADKREAKKLHPTQPAECEDGWLTELRGLGVDVDALRTAGPVGTGGMPVGAVDREEAAARVLRVLASGHNGHSTWNVWDIRGAAEEVLAGRNVIAEPAVFAELVEDIAARAQAASVSILDAPAPEHVRQFTSEYVVALEDDIKGRLAARSTERHAPASVEEVARALAAAERSKGPARVLDEGQTAAVRAIAGTAPLVVIEGAAGTGKTDVLATAKAVIESRGGRMRVVAPTMRAAIEAAGRLGTADGIKPNTAHWLAYQYGFRWDADGVWSRLKSGDVDPVSGVEYRGPQIMARLGPRDVLVCDEAGMLDQETARALLHIADESRARLVDVGDRRQLTAVGRGGYLDLAARFSEVHVELAGVHRFRREDGQRDTEYADLSLRIRSGVEPAATFDALAAAGHVQLHEDETAQLAEVARVTAERHIAGQSQASPVATNAQAEAINEIVRERLVEAGVVDDATVVHGADGLRIGAGDTVMTRLNDADKGVANREVWTVQEVCADGSVWASRLAERGRQAALVERGRRQQLDAQYVRQRTQLAYACTVHGVQGANALHCDTALSGAMDAPALYPAMTRGVRSNTVHIVAADLDAAREQWVAAAERNRADLGLDQARAAAASESRDFVPAETFAETMARKSAANREKLAARQRAEQQVSAGFGGYGESSGHSTRERERGPRL